MYSIFRADFFHIPIWFHIWIISLLPQEHTDVRNKKPRNWFIHHKCARIEKDTNRLISLTIMLFSHLWMNINVKPSPPFSTLITLKYSLSLGKKNIDNWLNFTGIFLYTSTRVNVIRDQACGNIAEKLQERLPMSLI